MSDMESKVGKVPFSWENRPGISKAATINPQQQKSPCAKDELGHDELIKKLPPPPYRSIEKTRVYVKDNNDDDQLILSVPLPPCAFHQPTSLKRSSSKIGRLIKKFGVDVYYGDPFLNAYKECTKTKSTSKSAIKDIKKGGFFGLSTSCKSSCSVRDDNLVKVSQLPYSFSPGSQKEGKR